MYAFCFISSNSITISLSAFKTTDHIHSSSLIMSQGFNIFPPIFLGTQQFLTEPQRWLICTEENQFLQRLIYGWVYLVLSSSLNPPPPPKKINRKKKDGWQIREHNISLSFLTLKISQLAKNISYELMKLKYEVLMILDMSQSAKDLSGKNLWNLMNHRLYTYLLGTVRSWLRVLT